ncbi:SDR family oxidoreductase [Gordonia sp. PKS22-38]|uniref:SDR family oxidoreductase n=1 Tax=Gordonia prachuapensis TaxID=3115651 RepID=A0ABU7MQ01_9ACTN|nr:SDR family oxidoreductase [Gordonia sp. PKS22-38]
MTTYFITGGNGFIGRRVIERLLTVEADARIFALVRTGSLPVFSEFLATVDNAGRVTALAGDLTTPGLGIDAADLPEIDHVIHLAAVYDMSADADVTHAVNVEGTAHVADFALAAGALMHHVSSIAVAGDHRGTFTEDDFDSGQGFPTPYHRTKFEAEKIVRTREGLRWRVYRPSVVVGDSRTGEMDKIDGPYYFFGHLKRLGVLPSSLPLPLPDLGHTNIVPVDFVAHAIVALCAVTPERSGLVHHLADPRRRTITDMYNAIAPGFRGPHGHNVIPNGLVAPVVTLSGAGAFRVMRDLVATQQGIPPILLDTIALTVDFRSDATIARLGGHGIALPDLDDYGPRLWTYWAEHLDPARHRRDDPRGPLVGKKIVITGGSSGIGKATARMCLARGADVMIVARDPEGLDAARAELAATATKAGVPPGRVHAYQCDITDEESVTGLVKTVLAEHGHVDILVNNAGRSIRRATLNATDRMHDYQRVMAVNYFGAVNLILALLPHMVARQSGHIVNVTSIAVQAKNARFGAYAASKAALEAFSDVVGVETLSDHITFTNVRLPLVRTRMIAPTEIYEDAGAWGVDKAASRVLHGIVDRPRRVNSVLGSLTEIGHRVAPGLTARVLHQEFLMFGESAAALAQGSEGGGYDRRA